MGLEIIRVKARWFGKGSVVRLRRDLFSSSEDGGISSSQTHSSLVSPLNKGLSNDHASFYVKWIIHPSIIYILESDFESAV